MDLGIPFSPEPYSLFKVWGLAPQPPSRRWTHTAMKGAPRVNQITPPCGAGATLGVVDWGRHGSGWGQRGKTTWEWWGVAWGDDMGVVGGSPRWAFGVWLGESLMNWVDSHAPLPNLVIRQEMDDTCIGRTRGTGHATGVEGGNG